MGDDRGADDLIDSVALDVLPLFGAGLIWFIGGPDVRLARARRRLDPFLTIQLLSLFANFLAVLIVMICRTFAT